MVSATVLVRVCSVAVPLVVAPGAKVAIALCEQYRAGAMSLILLPCANVSVLLNVRMGAMSMAFAVVELTSVCTALVID